MEAAFSPKNIKAIVFDAFGTLVHIGEKRRPYRRLLELARESGRVVRPDAAKQVMSRNLGLSGVAEWLGLKMSSAQRAELELELSDEIATIRLYEESTATVLALREKGFRLAICSNLASPYAQPILNLMPIALDAYAWSFEVGAVKPVPAIYQAVCASLGIPPGEILMIGDTYEADCAGPRRFGMQALHLARNGDSLDARYLRTLEDLWSFLD